MRSRLVQSEDAAGQRLVLFPQGEAATAATRSAERVAFVLVEAGTSQHLCHSLQVKPARTVRPEE